MDSNWGRNQNNLVAGRNLYCTVCTVKGEWLSGDVDNLWVIALSDSAFSLILRL